MGTPSVEWILQGGPLEVLIAGDSDHANIQQLLAWLVRRLQGDRQANLSLAGSTAPCPLCVASYSNRLAASSEPELGVLSCACLHKLSNPHGRHTPQAKCNAFEANSTHAADGSAMRIWLFVLCVLLIDGDHAFLRLSADRLHNPVFN